MTRPRRSLLFMPGSNARALEVYASLCGQTLARAHAKAGGAPRIAGYLGKSESFEAAIGRYAIAYADRTEQDYEALRHAAAKLAASPSRIDRNSNRLANRERSRSISASSRNAAIASSISPAFAP